MEAGKEWGFSTCLLGLSMRRTGKGGREVNEHSCKICTAVVRFCETLFIAGAQFSAAIIACHHSFIQITVLNYLRIVRGSTSTRGCQLARRCTNEAIRLLLYQNQRALLTRPVFLLTCVFGGHQKRVGKVHTNQCSTSGLMLKKGSY